MNALSIALRSVRGNPLRSATVFLCVFSLAMFFVATTLLVDGAKNSLDRGLERLGADILVVPEGAETSVENALLMGKPIKIWMPGNNLAKVAAVEGVARASPQMYLQSLYGAPCCAVSEMYIVVFDPATDFSITPWLKENLGGKLSKGEVIGGTYVFMPEGEEYLRLYGYNLVLKGILEPTGTGIDKTLFMSRETAEEMARWSTKTAVSPLQVPPDMISSVLVKVEPGADTHAVAVRLAREVPSVVAIESSNLFGTYRKQMLGFLDFFLAMLVVSYLVTVVIINLIFFMAAHERRREMAVLRANGAKPLYIFGALWAEAAVLAVAGGSAGFSVSSAAIYLFKDYFSGFLSMPFLFPSIAGLVGLFALTVLFSLVIASMSVSVPAYLASRQEPGVAMKE